MERGTASTIILIAVGASVAVLVAASIFFTLQPPTQLDPATPEGTAQGYFQAVSDGDQNLAESFMTADLARSCDGRWWYEDIGSTSRVVITGTKIEGDTAKVEVDITVSYGDEPFGGSSYDRDETVTMERFGAAWLISRPIWPMDRYACSESDN